MGLRVLFILVLAGCPKSPPAPTTPPPAHVVDAAVDAAAPDAAPVAPGVRGARCDERTPCADGLACDPLPGGYCASACEPGCCTEEELGDRCMASCTKDSDCREDEGYACDPMWHSCAIPNTTALVPNRCWLSRQPPDPAFAASAPTEVERDALFDAKLVAGKLEVHPEEGGLRVGDATTPIVGDHGDLVANGARVFLASVVGTPMGAYGSAEHHVDLVTSKDGGATWSAPVVVSGRDESIPYYLSGPAVAYDAVRDVVYVAYVRGHRRAVWDVVIATGKLERGERKFTRTAIGDGCVLHALPSLAIDAATGALHVAYYDSGARGLVHAVCASGACKERGVIADVDFSTAHTGDKFLGLRTRLRFVGRALEATYVLRGRALSSRASGG